MTIISELYDSLISLKVNRIKLRTHSKIDTFWGFERTLPPVKIKAPSVLRSISTPLAQSQQQDTGSLCARALSCWRSEILKVNGALIQNLHMETQPKSNMSVSILQCSLISQ